MALKKYPVEWTDEAKKNRREIHRYLAKEWTDREVRQFYHLLDERITLIATHPKMFPATEARNDVRRSVLIKQLSLYYIFDGHKIEILFLFDNRQDPEKLG